MIGKVRGQRLASCTIPLLRLNFFSVAAATSLCCSKGLLAMMTNRDSCDDDSFCCCVLVAESDVDVI